MRDGVKAPAGSPPGPSWLKRTGTGWTIAVRVQPGAKRSAVSGLHGERLKLRIAAPPIEGRANTAVAEFIAERLGVPRALVSIARGERSRDKVIEIAAPECDPAKLLASEE